MDPEWCNGTMLHALSWTAPSGFIFEEYWTSTSIVHSSSSSTVIGSWTIGNSGYFLPRFGSAVNDIAVIFRSQRPALLL
ncbi:MAG: hypothetical protein HFG16_01940 [Erysipelotrichaceae bacterium]|nr:hypothetical protein [Erysipelotrichaceae bacterium]